MAGDGRSGVYFSWRMVKPNRGHASASCAWERTRDLSGGLLTVFFDRWRRRAEQLTSSVTSSGYTQAITMTARIELLPRAGRIDRTTLESMTPHDIYACDLYVASAETWMEVPGGYRNGRVLNIDHHAPIQRMYRQVSSSNLAIAHVRESGAAQPNDLVVIDHTDCDSVLSAGIVSGRLESLESYGEAAIAADHTGAENGIADLLQAIEYRRDLDLSFRALEQWLCKRIVVSELRLDLEKRRSERAQALAVVECGDVVRDDEIGFAWVRNDNDIDAALFPGVMPHATLVLLTRPFPGYPGRWECKLRLCPAAPAGLTLFDLKDEDPELSFGGRWNAGSNKYGHGGKLPGSGVPPERYALELKVRLERALERTFQNRP